jgi:hypothetical protein
MKSFACGRPGAPRRQFGTVGLVSISGLSGASGHGDRRRPRHIGAMPRGPGCSSRRPSSDSADDHWTDRDAVAAHLLAAYFWPPLVTNDDSCEPLADVLNEKPSVPEAVRPTQLPVARGDLRFDRVRFVTPALGVFNQSSPQTAPDLRSDDTHPGRRAPDASALRGLRQTHPQLHRIHCHQIMGERFPDLSPTTEAPRRRFGRTRRGLRRGRLSCLSGISSRWVATSSWAGFVRPAVEPL